VHQHVLAVAGPYSLPISLMISGWRFECPVEAAAGLPSSWWSPSFLTFSAISSIRAGGLRPSDEPLDRERAFPAERVVAREDTASAYHHI